MSLHEITTLGLDDGGNGNTNDFFIANYDSMRKLIERKDRELEDIREFADFERQTLKAQIQEQENKMKSYSTGNTKVKSESGRIDSIGASAVTASAKVCDFFYLVHFLLSFLLHIFCFENNILSKKIEQELLNLNFTSGRHFHHGFWERCSTASF